MRRAGFPVAAAAWLLFACLAAITLVPPASTRMFSWPWSLAYVGTLVAPLGLLLFRTFDRSHPLVVPSPGWVIAVIGGTAVILGAALSSPFRGPALLWSAPELAALAVFLVVFDWIAADPVSRRPKAWRFAVWSSVLLSVTSIAEWAVSAAHTDRAYLLATRNPYPIGHSNYTAALALLMLPPLVVALGRRRGATSFAAAIGTVLAFGMLFTSGSRAAVFALVVLAAFGLILSPLRRGTKVSVAAAGLVAAAVFVGANPRTRAMFTRADPDAVPNISNVQREAMLRGGEWMGIDRPILGWGPGTTPLVFPRYRARLDGGAEDVLQLHSLPVQIWAEFGAAGIAAALFTALLIVRDARRDKIAGLALAGYAIFSVFDFQLDIPIFGFAIAAFAALVAAPGARQAGRAVSGALGMIAMAAFAVVVLFGRHDPTPELNAAALRNDFAQKDPKAAIALLRTSLARNPDQEIARFNLGWLLVVEDPPAAADEFAAAAHLVPDKGGVYFGLGLARLNAGENEAAIRAFALETLNDPAFQLSPWWKNPRLAPFYGPTLAQLAAWQSALAEKLPPSTWAGRELRYVRALNAWIGGSTDAATVGRIATTAARREYFAHRADLAAVHAIGARTLRHERIGYPVLMRNLDLAPPVDVWVVQESAARDGDLGFLWPDKGWLPSPLLIALLDEGQSRKN